MANDIHNSSTWSSKMSDSKQVPHRAGPLKQRNKSHKTGRHKTKGETSATNKGRLSVCNELLCLIMTIIDLATGRIGLKHFTGQRRKEARKVDKRNKV